MAGKMNPQDVAAKWATRTANAVSDYKAGVQAVKVSPGVSAAAHVDLMLAKLQEMAASGELQRRMASVSLADWQAATAGKGAERLATGARAAQPKMANFLSEFLPFVEQVKNNLPERGTMDQNIQRMVANVQAISQFRKRR